MLPRHINDTIPPPPSIYRQNQPFVTGVQQQGGVQAPIRQVDQQVPAAQQLGFVGAIPQLGQYWVGNNNTQRNHVQEPMVVNNNDLSSIRSPPHMPRVFNGVLNLENPSTLLPPPLFQSHSTRLNGPLPVIHHHFDQKSHNHLTPVTQIRRPLIPTTEVQQHHMYGPLPNGWIPPHDVQPRWIPHHQPLLVPQQQQHPHVVQEPPPPRQTCFHCSSILTCPNTHCQPFYAKNYPHSVSQL